MQLTNTARGWGLVSIMLHWLVAVAVIGLFPLGLYMTGLDYYDPMYRTAPAIHKGIGALLFIVVVLRLAWRLSQPTPAPLPSHSAFERRAGGAVHGLLYLLLISVMVSGYLISTADGRPIDVFGLIEIPAWFQGGEKQSELAGDIHLALAIALVSLAALHALAAFKHHLIDKDSTLKRMLGVKPN